jgi:GTP-binding protein LepA
MPRDKTIYNRFLEPMAVVSVICPTENLSNVDTLCASLRGERGGVAPFDESQTLTKWRLPLSEVYVNFFEDIKRITSGMASIDHKDDGYRECELTKISIYLNEKLINEFSQICPQAIARSKADFLVNGIKKVAL